MYVYVSGGGGGGGGGGGVLLLVFRGKILGFVKDELPRNHLPRMLSLITNEGDIEVHRRLHHKPCGDCGQHAKANALWSLLRCVAVAFAAALRGGFVWWCVLVV